eukprot:c17673_g1_i1 orf=323-601(-)
MASRASLMKSVAAACARSTSRRSVPVVRNVGAFHQPSNTLSSQVTRFRGAMVALQSLHPFHSAVSDSLFVSKLSFGLHDASFLQDLYGSKRR